MRPIGLAAFCATTALAACGDPLEATSRNNVDTFAFSLVVYPFSTAPTPLPTALNLSTPLASGVNAVRPTVVAVSFGSGSLLVPNFDFVVDVGGDGVRLVPSKLIAGLSTTGRALRTGVRVVDTPFDSLASAPEGDYQNDSATVIRPGQTLALDLESISCLSTSTRTSIFAKLVLDSVSATNGGVYFRGRVDPNCGFRSLRPGRPTN